MPADVLVRHWNEIGDGVARTGVRKILFFNSHGGNPPVMDIVSRDLRIRHGMLAAMANWYDLVPLSKWFGADELKDGIHGGEIETSVMLHLRPDLVDMTAASNFVSATVALREEFDLLSPIGRPSFAWETQGPEPGGRGRECGGGRCGARGGGCRRGGKRPREIASRNASRRPGAAYSS